MKPLIIMFFALCATCSVFAQNSKGPSPATDTVTNIQARYNCCMRPQVALQAGGCPKCEGNLLLSPKEKMKMEVMKLCTCPAHPHEYSKHAGTCSKCHVASTEMKARSRTKKS